MTTKRYHFIGIGGIGMGALAHLLLQKGCSVSGSDLAANDMTKALSDSGAKISVGHRGENVEGADFVVVSSAISQDNVELKQASIEKTPILRRADLLAELMEEKISITVAGAHGKTTTSAMISVLFSHAGLDPTTAVGGLSLGGISSAALGKSDYFIAEVDESDGTFLKFYPDYSVITNIDYEHLDHFKDWDGLKNAYRQFIGNTSDNGYVVFCGDDKNLTALVEASHKRAVKFGFDDSNSIVATNVRVDRGGTQFECLVSGENLGVFEICTPGRHNVLNALAVITIGWLFKIEMDVIKEGLKRYKGVKRRFQIKGDVDDVLVIDDYGHHPTEIEATLKAAQALKRQRIVTVFQPHRFTRTQLLMKDFVKALTVDSCLIVTDIYSAGEKPIDGVSAQSLVAQINDVKEDAVYKKKDEILKFLRTNIKPGDMVITLGAGDIYQVGEDLVNQLQSKELAFQQSIKRGA